MSIIASKFSNVDIFRAIEKQISRLNATDRVVVLADYPDGYIKNKFDVVPLTDITDDFLSANPAITFIYAIENNSVGLDIVRLLIKNNSVWYPCKNNNVGGYVFDNKLVRDIIEEENEKQSAEKFCNISSPGTVGDFVNLCQAIDATKHIDGDIVEIGVFRGSSSCVMLNFLQATNNLKKVWLLDTFAGFTYPEAYTSPDRIWKDTHLSEGYEIISSRIRSRAPDREGLEIQKLNIISDLLPQEIKKISMCNIDVDMLEAVQAALVKVAPLMAVGGIIICEDAGHAPALIGARLALDDFLQSAMGHNFTTIHMECGQIFLIKHS